MIFPAEIPGLNGADNISGLKQTVWAARVDEFLTMAGPVSGIGDSPVDITEIIRVTTDHAFDVGKGFHKLYTTLDTGGMEQAMAAARDQTGGMVTFTAQHPGHSELAAAFIGLAPNYEWIVLVETPDGKMLQIGQEGLTANIRGSKGTNTLTGDRNGHMLEISAFMPRILYYEGVITQAGA